MPRCSFRISAVRASCSIFWGQMTAVRVRIQRIAAELDQHFVCLAERMDMYTLRSSTCIGLGLSYHSAGRRFAPPRRRWSAPTGALPWQEATNLPGI